MASAPQPQTVALAWLDTDCGVQVRPALDEETLERYLQARENNDELPPIHVIDDGERGIVFDGLHRVEVARRRGEDSIAAIVEPGTLEDAMLRACTANRTNGLPLDNASKREAARRYLQAHTDWSDRRIAGEVGVGHRTVADVRGELESTGQIVQSTTRTSADGRQRPATQPPRSGPADDPWAGIEVVDDDTARIQRGEVAPAPPSDPRLPDFAEGDALATELRRLSKGLAAFAQTPAGAAVEAQTAGDRARQLLKLVTTARPFAVCPACDGDGCDRCRSRGWLTRAEHEALAKHFGGGE